MSIENNPKPQLVPEQFHQKAQHMDLLAREKAEEEAKKNHNFVQVEKRSLRDIRGLIDRSPNAAKLLFIMAEKMNRQNALLCSFKTLQEITGLSRTTLSNAVSLLKQEHWVQVIKVGTANAYVVNSRVFWQSFGNLKHAVFNATIIATAEEQDKETWDNIELRSFPMLASAEEAKLLNPSPKAKKDPRQIDFLEDTDKEEKDE